MRTRCAVSRGAGGYASIPLQADGQTYGSSTIPAASVVVSPFDPSLRSVVDSQGVVELADFRTTKVGGAEWAPAALPGNDRVLLAKRPANGGSPDADVYMRASGWCLLSTWDSPTDKCEPISSSASPGTPAVHTDGTVGWASATGVPFRLGGLGGWAQTDGKRLTRAEVLPPAKKIQGSSVLLDATGRAGWIDPSDLAVALGEDVSDPGSKRIAWFEARSFGADGVTAELHRSPVTTTQLARDLGSAFGNNTGAVYGVRVLGDALVLAVRISSDAVVIARVGSDGTVSKVATLPGDLEPRIISWPGN
ncbi:hypothetical protein [Kibdelosporangium aridum]|uniref:hypothetical protein n=1 Tax=Kibdelosporangium aridum TaxID=2030 RepID=UPI001C8BF059|nr:hypothetical protein [Kibdelosporangium aridum]